MNNKKIFSLIALVIVVIILTSFGFKENDPLAKRKFTINITEVKDGVAAKKSVLDEIEFNTKGQLFSNFLFDKYQYKWLKYRINKDSIFTDSTDTEVRQLDVEATVTDDKDQTIMINFTTIEWDIEGTIKMTKSDKPKKYYDFAGREKGGKPKKPKKPKKGQPIEGEQKMEEPK